MIEESKESARIILWILIYIVAVKLYEQYYIPKYGDSLSGSIIDVPHSIKCAFDEPQCETGDIDYWSIIHAVGFFVLGYFIPNQYLTVLILSVFIVIIEPYIGYKPKYIIDPLINITFYSLGSLVAPKKKYDYGIYVDKDDQQHINYD